MNGTLRRVYVLWAQWPGHVVSVGALSDDLDAEGGQVWHVSQTMN